LTTELLYNPAFVSKDLNLGVPYHVGIAVYDIDAAIKRYSEVFGIRRWRGRDPQISPSQEWHGNPVPQQGSLRWAYTITDFPWIAFVQPVGDADWMVPQFLRERGEGVHHIGYFVEDIEEAIKQAASFGIAALPTGPRPPGEPPPRQGVVYLDPKTTYGVSIELVPIQLRETLVTYVQTGTWKSADGRTPGERHDYIM
jgi:methylmalonyl-CoA/ethylmalonyl-CoA epimerase